MKLKISKKFLKINKNFWRKFKEPESENILLVETSGHPVINHANAVVGKMIALARNLRIGWLEYPYTSKPLMQSYSPNSLFIKFYQIDIQKKLWFFSLSLICYIKHILFKNDILNFVYKKIPYGDLIYDSYLAKYKMATLHRFDCRLIIIIFRLLLNDEEARVLFKNKTIRAVLVSHYIGLSTGPLTRVALQKKIPVFWKGGGHKIINFSVFKNLKQIYNYPNKPTHKIINLLVNKYSDKIKLGFDRLIKESQNSPNKNILSIAYNNKIFSNINRKKFLKQMKLRDKPLVFVMLHAFNDHPHSHFKKMLFNDYYDWFSQTLHFAYSDKSKNWIFKEHPANKFYPTRDLDFDRVMRYLPNNIRFVSKDSDIKAATVLNVADLIITCLGTAGIEMPALKGIPSLIAGQSTYSGFGFTIEPQTKEEYFRFLKDIKPTKLTNKQRLRAKCCYLYLNKYCMLPFSAGPDITVEENKNPKKLAQSYLPRIINEYKKNKRAIEKEFFYYSDRIKKNNFISLTQLSLNNEI